MPELIRPANFNAPPFGAFSWAPWAAAPYALLVWNDVALSAFSAMLSLQQTALDASREMATDFPTRVLGQDLSADAVLSAARQEFCACGETLIQAQADALAALQQTA